MSILDTRKSFVNSNVNLHAVLLVLVLRVNGTSRQLQSYKTAYCAFQKHADSKFKANQMFGGSSQFPTMLSQP